LRCIDVVDVVSDTSSCHCVDMNIFLRLID